jgi:hypothetical protein
VHGGALVELQQAGVVEVGLPPELPEPPLQHLVRGHHLAARDVDQHLVARPAAAATTVARRVAIGAAHHAVLKYPHTGHDGFPFLATGDLVVPPMREAGPGTDYIQQQGTGEMGVGPMVWPRFRSAKVGSPCNPLYGAAAVGPQESRRFQTNHGMLLTRVWLQTVRLRDKRSDGKVACCDLHIYERARLV